VSWNKGLPKEMQPMYGKHHTKKSKQKIRNSNKGQKRSDATRKRISESHIGQLPWNKGKKCPHFAGDNNPSKRPDVKVILIENHWSKKYPAKWKRFKESRKYLPYYKSQPRRLFLSQRMIGEKNPMKDLEVREKMKNSLKNAWNTDMKHNASVKAFKQWESEDFRKKMYWSRMQRPNSLESRFFEMLPNKISNQLKYTGNFKFRIQLKKRNKFPDYLVRNQKKCIEIFGSLWHKNASEKEQLIKEMNEVGWGCLVFWDYELKNQESVIKNVERFLCE
jgi:very-short-patch-repair endonuclease